MKENSRARVPETNDDNPRRSSQEHGQVEKKGRLFLLVRDKGSKRQKKPQILIADIEEASQNLSKK